jgi:hypothetical protein
MTIAFSRIGSLLLVLALAVAGCEESPGEGALGDPCETDGDCASLLCVGGVAGPEGACTQSCATNEECPEGWSCGAVTQSGVIVCRRGASTPFGQ